jgi:hypothetical protein
MVLLIPLERIGQSYAHSGTTIDTETHADRNTRAITEMRKDSKTEDEMEKRAKIE